MEGVLCTRVVENYSRIGAKSTAKKEPLSPSGAIKNKKPPDLTREGNSNDLAHVSIILVFVVPHPSMSLLHAYARQSFNLSTSIIEANNTRKIVIGR